MTKNRRTEVAAVRLGPALKAFVLALLLGGSGVGYVSQKNELYALGEQIKLREQARDDQRRQNETLSRTLALLQTHRELEARVREMKLDLTLPLADQVVRLRESDLEKPEAGEQFYAGRPREE